MICKTCEKEKPEDLFYFRSGTVIRMHHCKECYKSVMAKRRSAQRDVLATKQREYRKRKPEICARAAKNYAINNKEKFTEYQKQYYLQHKSRIRGVKNLYQKQRLQNDPSYRIRKSISRRLSSAMFTSKTTKRNSVMKYLGCSIAEFKIWLEKKFTKKMNWDNYGKYWNIDHILPCAAFDHNDEKQVYLCWHFTNMRPMNAIDNIKKSDKITEPQMSLLI